MKIGYARTSTLDQCAGLAGQLRDLLVAQGCEEIFQEQVSSVAPRAQLAAALRMLRRGDHLVATKLDRAFRSVEHAITTERLVREKGATLEILDPHIDTKTAMGRLVFNVLASVAQWEREMMLERQREGIAKAKAEGKYRGRQPTARRRLPEVQALRAQGVKIAEIARRLGLPRQTVHRLLAEAQAAIAVVGEVGEAAAS